MTQLIEARVRESMGPKSGKWREGAPVITFREGPTYSVEPQYIEEYHWLEATEPDDTTPEPEPEDASPDPDPEGADEPDDASSGPDHELPLSASDYLKDELQSIADELGVEYTSSDKKSELEAAINEHA